jgi:hypothetical protein
LILNVHVGATGWSPHLIYSLTQGMIFIKI